MAAAVEEAGSAARFMVHREWADALFVHWRVDRAALSALLPPDLEPEPFVAPCSSLASLSSSTGAAAERETYFVGLVLLAENGIAPRVDTPLGPLGLPGGLALSHLAANVRTYARLKRDPAQTGIFFFSLDCSSRVATLGARALFSLRYRHASITHGASPAPKATTPSGGSATSANRTCNHTGGTGGTASTATGATTGATDHTFEVRHTGMFGPTAPVPLLVSAQWQVHPERRVDAGPGTFARWAVERYALFTVGAGIGTRGLGHAVVPLPGGGGSVFRGTIRHAPWRLCAAELARLDTRALEAVGLPTPSGEPIVFAAAEPVTDVEFRLFQRA